jgi:hypothetical protein
MSEQLTRIFRFLFFRFTDKDYDALTHRDLSVGLFMTWIVGMGRTWDKPDASFFQHIGIGSLVYVFVLSGFLWLLYKPIIGKHISYRNLLTTIVLTSLPAVMYAIPAEQYMNVDDAIAVNAMFLLIVATWRVGLLMHFLRVACKQSFVTVGFLTLLPLAIIVAAISFIQYERVVLESMGGFVGISGTKDDIYYILDFLFNFSWALLLPLLLFYVLRIAQPAIHFLVRLFTKSEDVGRSETGADS